MRIAMIGTRGVPARYGGFETCIEEVGQRLAEAGHDILVYCRDTGEPVTGASGDASGAGAHHGRYRGMRTVRLGALRRRSLETLSHTALSVRHLLAHEKPDAAIVFNSANAPMLPALRRRGIPVATHVDGLEWQRAKWGPMGQRYYRVAETLAVRWSDALIADATGIADYYAREFGAPTHLISYGAPHVEARGDGVPSLGLPRHGYHLVVARFEPENHVDVIVEGYGRSSARMPLAVVGSAPYSGGYIARVTGAADERVRFLGSVWDQDLLDQLYAQCHVYWHGHSVGGTNPSLLRAVGAGAATHAFDVCFNREVLGAAGEYFTDAADVARLVEASESRLDETAARREASRGRAALYGWDDVAEAYGRLCEELAHGLPHRARSVGGRRRVRHAGVQA